MHELVQMLYLTRDEFNRNLQGLTDEDVRRRIEPMNCISWIIAHVANQHRAFFVDWPAGRETDPRYKQFGYGSPASQPSLKDAITLWNDACRESDAWLKSATEETLKLKGPITSPEGENYGTLMVRCIFHTWCHLGEISSIRQILGHRAPQFVNMYGWSYPGT